MGKEEGGTSLSIRLKMKAIWTEGCTPLCIQSPFSPFPDSREAGRNPQKEYNVSRKTCYCESNIQISSAKKNIPSVQKNFYSSFSRYECICYLYIKMRLDTSASRQKCDTYFWTEARFGNAEKSGRLSAMKREAEGYHID